YETTWSLLATDDERHSGCCERDPRSTTTFGPMDIGRALGLPVLILKPLSFQLVRAIVHPAVHDRDTMI
ncbi:hypothetical protein ALC56_10655, partial [Trachymyrmex septentrionalis]